MTASPWSTSALELESALRTNSAFTKSSESISSNINFIKDFFGEREDWVFISNTKSLTT